MEIVDQRIARAGDTVVPAQLALESIGLFVAPASDNFIAPARHGGAITDGPVALLTLLPSRAGPIWDRAATDTQIDETIRRYDLG